MGMNKDCSLKECRFLEVRQQELPSFIYPFFYCPKLDKGLTALYPPQKGETPCEQYEGKGEGSDGQ